MSDLGHFDAAVLATASPYVPNEVLDWLDGCGLEAAFRLMRAGHLVYEGELRFRLPTDETTGGDA